MRPDSTFPGERFDEHASDLDSWRADQERLRAAEESAHARLDRAALRMVSGPGPYASALDLPGSPADCVDLLPERSAARDAWTLDRIAERFEASQIAWDSMERFLGMMRAQNQEPAGWSMQSAALVLEVLELIRSTGRTC